MEYNGIDNLTLGVLNVAFDKGADETDFTASYDLSDNMTVDIIYHHMHSDGDMLLVMYNLDF
ncbi:hypothetical protein [Pseudoalteromonas denitrificans]|uniref:Porin n=1 Tax=Pseudoalteromonas denitrificans DSM 6059 TaxID=1123010 RepID=A0A1I1S3H2_9GAMM|nr:hypothetical protein [Pseudoalteromonas denitrificans]SFD41076.1 hypothetical protein SAMN02745724_04441 [Pseudoalteromonas denitrificans DSM 6059]